MPRPRCAIPSSVSVNAGGARSVQERGDRPDPRLSAWRSRSPREIRDACGSDALGIQLKLLRPISASAHHPGWHGEMQELPRRWQLCSPQDEKRVTRLVRDSRATLLIHLVFAFAARSGPQGVNRSCIRRDRCPPWERSQCPGSSHPSRRPAACCPATPCRVTECFPQAAHS